jgi:CRISPR-associated protein Csx3
MNRNSQVQLDVAQLQTELLSYQLLVITLSEPGDLFLSSQAEQGNPFFNHIKPAELEALELPAQLNFNQGIVLFGQAPIWLFAHLVHQCHPAPWIATYDIRSRTAVVVKSSIASPQVGDIISVPTRTTPGIAIAIGGPPDSGKSVLSNALRSTLWRAYPDLKVFLHRANWDGEGNWSYETPDRETVQVLIQRGEYRIHKLPNSQLLIQSYFKYHAQATANIRQLVDVAIVDLGGKPNPEKTPVVEQCTHYLIISSQPETISAWHDLFNGLKPLAVLHSKASPDFQTPTNSPFMEQTINLAELIQTQQIPNDVMETIAQTLPNNG